MTLSMADFNSSKVHERDFSILRLLFSLTSRFLFIALLKDKKCLASVSQDSFRQHSEKFFPALQKILTEAGYSLKDVGEVYFTDLPGSQTGQRISLAFVLTLQVLNPQFKAYHLNSLLFQAGKDKAISLISIDLKKTKYQLAVYQKTQCIIEPQVVESKELTKIKKQFPDYIVYEDFYQASGSEFGQTNRETKHMQPINFLVNFQKLFPYFQLLEPKLSNISQSNLN
jgi:tRNA threonylcarbamoyladenosine biosynthesis protein TsaB